MSLVPADWALATTHLASDYVCRQFCAIVGVTPKVLPPPELDVVLMLGCSHLARILADAYLNPVTINFDMTRYSEVLQKQERGVNPGREEFLLTRYPPDREIILECPAVVLDKFGLIVLWYLPGTIDAAIQNDMLSATMMMSGPLGKSITRGTSPKDTWRTHESNFQISEHGLTSGCINLSPGWFLQAHPAPQFHPEVSATLKSDDGAAYCRAMCRPAALVAAALRVMHSGLYWSSLTTQLGLGVWAETPLGPWHQPKEDSHASKVLRAGPTIHYEDFIPHQIKKSLKFGLVSIHSHVWIDVSEVRYTVFKCGADGHFDFNSKNSEMFAEGVRSFSVLSLMEGMGLEESLIRSAGESRPVWDPMWEAAVNQISTAVYLTAYCCYVDWHHHKYKKRKLSHQAVTQATTTTSGTSLSSTDPTAGSSSDPTTSSSSDEPHTPSTGLSVDVELERAVKKAKVGDDKSPKAKALLFSSSRMYQTKLHRNFQKFLWNFPALIWKLLALVQKVLPKFPTLLQKSFGLHWTFSGLHSEVKGTYSGKGRSARAEAKPLGISPTLFAQAIGALQTHRSPVSLHHLTTPGITNYRFSATTASAKVSTQELACEDSDDESTNSNDTSHNKELQAQLVLNVTRAQWDICLAENKLADCILKENTALGVLYQFEATEAERKLEDINMDIGYVHHSLRKSGIMLYEDSGSGKPPKHRRTSASSSHSEWDVTLLPESEPAQWDLYH
ncbi:uncharacterized protein HD556DRAFT_1449392 [Suillus plorans]|uniref:Uncharacterized protein n=1 Tax=Suillus plorans TaxID=116603 RepID=A0A9P7DAZ9_9AGAM|nr:uncharacterized protein HD556DRAFT_1449392 [Suillus plorans]KAG1786734.1 hypothetical protein HD556DRAFT_1449392 [Suillus plorans]